MMMRDRHALAVFLAACGGRACLRKRRWSSSFVGDRDGATAGGERHLRDYHLTTVQDHVMPAFAAALPFCRLVTKSRILRC
jgi:hypothetical protein